ASIGPFQAIFVALSIVLRPIGRRLTRGLFGRSCFAYHQYYRNERPQNFEPLSREFMGVDIVSGAKQHDQENRARHVRSNRGPMNPQTKGIIIPQTIAPMNPAPSPSLYQPTAWPRYAAKKAQITPSTVVQMTPVGPYLFPG